MKPYEVLNGQNIFFFFFNIEYSIICFYSQKYLPVRIGCPGAQISASSRYLLFGIITMNYYKGVFS